MVGARGLVKRHASTTAVDSLSFDIQPGTVTGFLRPNGAGQDHVRAGWVNAHECHAKEIADAIQSSAAAESSGNSILGRPG